MEEAFFDHSTERDSPAVAAFFCDLLVSPHEPTQTFARVDDVTGNLVNETISPGAVITSVCSDDVSVQGPLITTNAGSRTYKPYPIQIVLPQSGTERIEMIQLVADNIDRAFVDILRRLQFPMKVNVAVGYVLATDATRTAGSCPSFEHRFSGLDLIDVTISPETITGQLIIDNVLWKKYPNNFETYTPENFPALWGIGS